jgi:hypothetical protein
MGGFLAIFLDTGFYLGLCHEKDKYSERSKAILEKLSNGEYGLLYTSIFIISEATTLATIRSNSNLKVLTHLENLLWGDDKLATIFLYDLELIRETWNLFKKINCIDLKKDKPMSFVDISTIILCQTHQIDKIVSFDSHFDRFFERIF